MICPNCNTENPERNYYCKWCGNVLKDTAGRQKRLQERYDYLLDLPIVTDDSRDRDDYKAYRAKRK